MLAEVFKCVCVIFLIWLKKAAAVCKSTERLKVKKWRDTTGWDRYTIPQTWNERMWKTQKEKEHSQVRMEKKEGVIFSKVCSTRLLLLPTRPADSTQHTHIPSKDPQPSVAALTHCQTHYKSLHLHVYTQFLIVFSLKCQRKGALAACGASFFVCLFGVHASCPEFDLLKEEKKER